MLINTGLCNGYILDLEELIVYDVIGTEFKFHKLENAIKFMYEAKSYNESRNAIYEKLK